MAMVGTSSTSTSSVVYHGEQSPANPNECWGPKSPPGKLWQLPKYCASMKALNAWPFCNLSCSRERGIARQSSKLPRSRTLRGICPVAIMETTSQIRESKSLALFPNTLAVRHKPHQFPTSSQPTLLVH